MNPRIIRSICLVAVFLVQLGVNSTNCETVSLKYIFPTSEHSSEAINDTLDHWIINDPLSLFTNHTKIVLVLGVHEIYSPAKVLIEEVNSLTVIGQDKNRTEIQCNRKFYFHFMLVTNVKLLNFTVTNCAYILQNMMYKNVWLLSVLYQSVIVHATEFSFVFSDSDNLTVEGVSIHQKGGVFIHHNVSRQTALNPHEVSTIDFIDNDISVAAGVGMGFVIPKRVLKPVVKLMFKNNTLNNACILVKILRNTKVVADIQIKGLMMKSPKCDTFHPLQVSVLRNVYFQDVKIIHGNHSRETYISVISQSVTIIGSLYILHNNYGQTYISGCNITINSRTLIYFVDNDIQWRITFKTLFHISLCNKDSHLKIENSMIVFENNSVPYVRIFQVENGRCNVTSSKVIFRNNVCQTSSADDPLKSTVFMLQGTEMFQIIRSKFLFENNSAEYLSGGITLIKKSTIYCDQCELNFSGNTGGDGGAMSFYGKSQIRFAKQNNRCLKFETNQANNRGGAVYVEDSDYTTFQDMTRFFEFGYSGRYTSSDKYGNITTYFDTNFALVAGNNIYGGWIDQRESADNIWPAQSDDYYSVASDPVRICICLNLSVQCSVNNYVMHSIPGEVIHLYLVAVGQRYGIVPSKILISSLESSRFIKQEGIYAVERECTEFHIPVKSNQSKLVMRISPEGSLERISRVGWSAKQYMKFTAYKDLFKQLNVTIKLKECPLGFVIDNSIGSCVCMETHKNPRFTCNISNFKVIIPQQKWINATFIHKERNARYGIIVHNHCPYDYCKSVKGPQSIRLEHPSDQCSNFRRGILCGKCQPTFSNILGSSSCRKCSNYWVLAVIPATAIAGILLLVFMTALNLTVSSGVINGIIFYANIVRANQQLLIPSTQNSQVYTFLEYFMAWLNLDLGIETCFYDGFNAYAMAWLQFMFPIYVWLIMIIVIVSSHYSTTASKLCGNNGVSVLATLFLLSYTKILRTVITVYSSTTIEYPDGFRRSVWIYDANIDYLKGKHIPLFIMATLMLTILSIPYTLSLLMIQCLRRISHYRILVWVNRLMPLFDSYVGPYKFNHYYWTGLLLLARVTVLLVLSLNQSNNPTHNFTAIGCIIFTLLAYLSYIGGVYKNKIINMMEIIMMLNLGLLSIGILYSLQMDGHGSVVICTSVGITFTFFVSVVLFHTWREITSTQIGQSIKSLIIRKCHYRRIFQTIVTDNNQDNIKFNEVKTITHTSLELDEPLLTNGQTDAH